MPYPVTIPFSNYKKSDKGLVPPPPNNTSESELLLFINYPAIEGPYKYIPVELISTAVF